MICLGIESSCDETALALVENGTLIDSVLASQAPAHSIFGGVVPELASREHYRYIGPLFDQLLARNRLSPVDLDAIAVARGPGLLGSLLVGVSFAKALSFVLGIPLLGVNHLHAHLLAVGLEHEMRFPALGLLVSGGHTQLYRIESPWNFIELGRTLDDAAGEVFDKIANVLNLAYPGGKAINELANKGLADRALLPRPYLDNDSLDFSFSGLKTAAINVFRSDKGAIALGDKEKLQNFCASFNLAIADTLVEKTKRAFQQNSDLNTLWLAGGVAANSIIRKALSELMHSRQGQLLAPAPNLCADNGPMIAHAGYLLAQAGFYHGLEMESVPRGRKIPSDMSRNLAKDAPCADALTQCR